MCGLHGTAMDRLELEGTSHTYRRGQLVFAAGARAQVLHVIRSGKVKVFRTWHDGDEQVLRLLGPGEILGYRPLFSDEPYLASAEAVEDSVICAIPQATVDELVRSVPGLAGALLRKLAQELRLSEELMMDLVRRPVRQRAARLLLRLLEDNRNAPDPAAILSRELMHKDMARMIGATPETFSRVLRGFAQSAVVKVTRGSIRVLDETRLRRIAGELNPSRLDHG